jgi:choline dehydrogenase
VIGGCSAHNACIVVRGTPADYDEWAHAGWSFARVEPFLRRAEAAIGTRRFSDEELSAWHRAVLAAGPAIGLPRVDDLNDLREPEGVGTFPLNAAGTVRMNAAFAYLDPARGRPNLTVVADTLVDRVRLRGGRAVSLLARRGSEALEIEADLIVLAAGAYSSPAILLRSGVGPAADLDRLAVDVALDVPAVGANLIDHVGVGLGWEPRPALLAELIAELGDDLPFEAQTFVKARSSACVADAWDLHVVPWLSAARDERGVGTGSYEITAAIFALKPESRGRVSLRSTDPARGPAIEHGFLSDPGAVDRRALVDGIELTRRLAAADPLAGLVGDETRPGKDADLDDYLRSNVRGYFHPVGTCAMGPAGDRDAVVDGSGRVHGLDGLHVCDASIMPTIPRANTHLSVLALAEGIADELR